LCPESRVEIKVFCEKTNYLLFSLAQPDSWCYDLIGWRYFGRAEQTKAGALLFDPGHTGYHSLLLFGVGCFTNEPGTPGGYHTDGNENSDSHTDDHPNALHHADAFNHTDYYTNLDSYANSN
jgi:hypothetical protein